MIGWFPKRSEFCNSVIKDLYGVVKRVKGRQSANGWRRTGRKNLDPRVSHLTAPWGSEVGQNPLLFISVSANEKFLLANVH